jgi:hypothetical protein
VRIELVAGGGAASSGDANDGGGSGSGGRAETTAFQIMNTVNAAQLGLGVT